MQAIPVEGNFTEDLITDVIENQVLPLLPANSYLVADNASVHNEIVLCRILARKNITLVKLPGYSYDLNPIEMVFGQAKAIARFTPGFLKENTMLAIVSAFEQISPLNGSDCRIPRISSYTASPATRLRVYAATQSQFIHSPQVLRKVVTRLRGYAVIINSKVSKFSGKWLRVYAATPS